MELSVVESAVVRAIDNLDMHQDSDDVTVETPCDELIIDSLDAVEFIMEVEDILDEHIEGKGLMNVVLEDESKVADIAKFIHKELS